MKRCRYSVILDKFEYLTFEKECKEATKNRQGVQSVKQRVLLHRCRIYRCVLTLRQVSVVRVFILNRHSTSKCEGYCANSSSHARSRRAKELVLNLVEKRKQCLYSRNKLQEPSIQASFLTTYNIAKHNKPFLDCEFVKQCVVHVSEAVCPENETAFENTSLSRRTAVHRMDEMSNGLVTVN